MQRQRDSAGAVKTLLSHVNHRGDLSANIDQVMNEGVAALNTKTARIA
jgi:hypothetical protein